MGRGFGNMGKGLSDWGCFASFVPIPPFDSLCHRLTLFGPVWPRWADMEIVVDPRQDPVGF